MASCITEQILAKTPYMKEFKNFENRKLWKRPSVYLSFLLLSEQRNASCHFIVATIYSYLLYIISYIDLQDL